MDYDDHKTQLMVEKLGLKAQKHHQNTLHTACGFVKTHFAAQAMTALFAAGCR